ncbi:MAG TPA: Na+/H+ antiporter subunit D [Candidatus Sumerlaeota bacterium]|nr:MAG: Na(+)/H(+) antiporter subunit D [candidate division BRC1 bacterium ADurb.BinA292]HOE96918.1 Na+/H+ antiporter subunit D [Candidatus Sumerlaeota bacterium]HOR27651.1 Na+/H+ antiporter subunit D [Candidatus Sumerlaeota bacterium]HPK02972.1 Na+/H+ antiporter subunit D [Candidatus Sumerlaeota bacterium]
MAATGVHVLLLCPVLIPLLGAIFSIFGWNRRRYQRTVLVVGMALLLAAAVALLRVVSAEGIQSVQVGNWPAPFGITFVADLFSAIMVLLGAMMGLAVAVYSFISIDVRRESFGYYPLFNTLMMGVSGAFLTGDLFNMYVWFEVMLISSFVLLALGGERAQLEGSIKYVTLNLLSSAVFLAGVGILYSVVGSLNMADIARLMSARVTEGIALTIAMMFLIAFGIKAAIFPMFFWLPASYHTPPVAVSAIFAGLLTKVGVYSLIRVFTLIFVQNPGYTHGAIAILAGFTMICGVLGAAAQMEFRRVLSFHIISQIGYMILGLGFFTPLALAGSVFYLIHHIIVKTNLFLVSGVVHRLQGTYQLKPLGGLYKRHPLLGLLFLIPAMSLAGVPPLSGFWAKFILIREGLELRHYLLVAAALVTSILTLYSMSKIWVEVFWKDKPESRVFGGAPIAHRLPRIVWVLYLAPIVALALCTVIIGLAAEPVFALSLRAAEQLMDPQAYIEAILGGG